MRKGDRIYVEGRIEYRTWEDREKQTRYVTEIIAREVILLSSRGGGGGEGAGEFAGAKAAAKVTAEGKAESLAALPEALDEEDDDLPFCSSSPARPCSRAARGGGGAAARGSGHAPGSGGQLEGGAGHVTGAAAHRGLPGRTASRQPYRGHGREPMVHRPAVFQRSATVARDLPSEHCRDRRPALDLSWGGAAHRVCGSGGAGAGARSGRPGRHGAGPGGHR